MIEDDFERFCRIGKGYHSPNLHAQRLQSAEETYDQQEQQSSGGRHDFLTAPQSISRYRSSSLRENPRRSPYHGSPRSSLTQRREVALVGVHSPGGQLSLSTDLPGSSRRHSLAPTFKNTERQPLQGSPYSRSSVHQFDPALETTNEEPVTRARHSSDRTHLDRTGSARSTAEVENINSRHSSGAGTHAHRKISASVGLTIPGVPPIQVFSEDSPETSMNVVRVRSFRRTKNGVVSQGDSDVFYRPANEACNCRHSFSCGSELMAAETAGGSREANNAAEADSSEEQSPQTTTTTRRKSRHGSAHERPRKKLSHQDMYMLDKVEAARTIRRKSLTPTWNCSDHSDTESVVKMSPQTYTVQVLGAVQVGKTTMCTQFMTSETLDDSADYVHEGDIVQNVTVDIDNEQTTLRFIENAESQNASIMDSADAYVVVYAIDDRESFIAAQNIVSEVLGCSKMSSTIVLVGNKADLVRTREVSNEEGRNLANVYSCGFYEVSISLNHRVNELLVGLVSAIKSANQRVQEERQRLSRIASLKANTRKSLVPTLDSASDSISGSKRRHISHNIRRFFQKYFPNIKSEK
ncbi:hypothetical protein AAHC03_020643 [Spirometra sp. Aus1]